MKFLTLFAAIVAVAVAHPFGSPWTLQELSETLSNRNVNPNIVPILEEALNTLMQALHEGHDFESINVALPANVAILDVPDVEPVNPAPVIPMPIEVPSAFSPLVQLTINVNSQQVPGAVAVNPVDVVAVNPMDRN